MALIVRLDSEGVPIVKFSKDEELQKVLCEVPILKTRPASVVQIALFSKCSFKGNIQLSVESKPRFLISPGNWHLSLKQSDVKQLSYSRFPAL